MKNLLNLAILLSSLVCFSYSVQGQDLDSLYILNGYRKEYNNEAFVYYGIRVNAKTGKEEAKENYASTDYIDLGDFNGIVYDLPYSASAGISFYDKNKKIIESLAKYSTQGGTYNSVVSKDVKFVRFCRRIDMDRGDRIIFYGATQIEKGDALPLSNDNIINQMRKFQIFSNSEYKYNKDGEDYFYHVTMPNHQMLNNGIIVAVAELFGDGRYLAIKRSLDGGKTWNNEVYFENEKLKDGIIKDNASGGNPVLLYDRERENLFLFYQPRSYRVSKDGGLSWGKKISVDHLLAKDYEGYNYYASPCNGIQLTNGILALAYRIENIHDDYDRVCVMYSRDGGDTWEVTPPTPINDIDGNIIYADETALVEYKKNCIMLNSRGFTEANCGKQINRRVFIQSNKGSSNPKKWKVQGWEIEPESDKKLLDPVCQGSLIKADLYGKQFGVFTNLYTEGPIRENLLVRVSSDFKHWSQCFFLSQPGEEVHGYSSMSCINNIFSVVSEDSKGVYYLPFGYEMIDKLIRTYSENYFAYQ